MSPCKAQPVLLLVGLGVDDFQQLLAVHTVNSAGLLHSLTAAAGAAQAMHTNGEENGGRLRSDIQETLQRIVNEGSGGLICIIL